MTKKVRLVLSLLGEENVTEGINGGGCDALRIPDGEPYAGKPHVWFDEGGFTRKGRPAQLYTFLFPKGIQDISM